MFAQVTCPACNDQFGVPEAAMGKRISCRNCQTPFVAGKSEAISVGSQASGEAGFNKTMLTDEDEPIRYNCPRCKTALQAPLIEAGKKKPCPSCGQRHQVPAAPQPQSGLNKTMVTSEDGSQPNPALNRTMLTDDDNTGPPIQYNCPRCKKSLTAPAAEAGTKKSCSSCGQRHKVPDAPAAQDGFNKTMLADGSPAAPPIRYECPRCKKQLEAPAAEAKTKKSCTSCGQRHQVPDASTIQAGLNKTMLASDGVSPAGFAAANPQASPMSHTGAPTAQQNAGGIWAQHFEGRPLRIGVLIAVGLFLGLVVVPSVIRGGRAIDKEALEKAKAELAALKADIERKQEMYEQQRKLEAEQKEKWDRMMADLKKQEEKLAYDRKLAEANLRLQNNQKLKEEEDRKLREQEAKLNREKQELAMKKMKEEAELKAKIAALEKQVESAQKQATQTRQTIVHQPPVYYHPPYDYRYYRWWYP